MLPPGANVSCCCARLDVCHVEVLLLTGDLASLPVSWRAQLRKNFAVNPTTLHLKEDSEGRVRT